MIGAFLPPARTVIADTIKAEFSPFRGISKAADLASGNAGRGRLATNIQRRNVP
jgi:hypothetical protein